MSKCAPYDEGTRAHAPTRALPIDACARALLIGIRARALLIGAALVLPALCGCASWTYSQLRLGQRPQDYERVLPADRARRTSTGVCAYQQNALGDSEAIVVLLTSDRRIAGKLRATRVKARWGQAFDAYALTGELDRELYDAQETGPLDTLRALAGELADYSGERLAAQAHELAAAGLIRLVQRWPHALDLGVREARAAELLELAAGGGEAGLSVGVDGVFRFWYRVGRTERWR